MIADDETVRLTDAGLNARLLKTIWGNRRLLPTDWMFKSAEELDPECDPVSFTHTQAMDVYSFARTAYAVRSRPSV